ncbi:lysM and putative peptidoglycan-binding domain-containing protein 2-like [Actinia tenebrosa]|uniref:LysM and putative peptidoglycan-binding domain-containing protein 2-like n=1 Tax=Actinia tenebrosa TaxID=6105 RepID=A0A6P8H536_ACTTE|nr:lysM and putative peptidoglycan-binding domain-containing protein 2-like [Actinia tenebrosa]
MSSSEGGSSGTSQASHLLASNRKLIRSEKSSLSGSFEPPKSYGSTTKPVRSEVDIKMIGHVVQSLDTLQGLSIRYGVPGEEIRRVNKLWTNDNIHFYKIIKIPVKVNSTFVGFDELDVDVEQEKHDLVSENSDVKDSQPGTTTSNVMQTENTEDSVSQFLEQLDGTIKQNVQRSEKLRLHSGKELLEKLERDQHASRTREDDLFRPLSFSSPNQRASRQSVNRSKSDIMNTCDEQFFEL